MLAGFADPVLDTQRVFRLVLESMAHPGRITEVPAPEMVPYPLHEAVAAVCLTLVDFETPVWLDPIARTQETSDYLRFHCGCRFVEAPGMARFAVVASPEVVPSLSRFDLGTDESPEGSTTVIIQVRTLESGRGRRLTGPGIRGEARLEARGLPPTFWNGLKDNHARFPRGVDVLFAAGGRIAALPRTTVAED